MRLDRNEWGRSIKMDKSCRTVPHIYWDVERSRYCCLWSKNVGYYSQDYKAEYKAESYVRRLNQTKQAHPVK